MAKIGLSKPYYAIYKEADGVVSYEKGGLLGKATELKVDLEGSKSNVLYADNGAAESDNQFAGGTITISTDDILPTPMLEVLGLKAEQINAEGLNSSDAKWIISDDSQEIPYVGFGGIIKKKINNSIKWVAVIFTKVQFNNPGESAVTQGESIEWQTEELTGTLMRDDSPTHVWRMKSTPLNTEAEAELVIKNKLGIGA